MTVLLPHAAGGFRKEMLDAVRVLPGAGDGRSLGLAFEIEGLVRHRGAQARSGHRPGQPEGPPSVGPGRRHARLRENLATDADFAFARETGQGTEWGLVYATRLDYAGRTAFHMRPTPLLYQGPFEFRVPEPRAKGALVRGRAGALSRRAECYTHPRCAP